MTYKFPMEISHEAIEQAARAIQDDVSARRLWIRIFNGADVPESQAHAMEEFCLLATQHVIKAMKDTGEISSE